MVRISPVPKNQDVERIQNDIKITTQIITGTDTMGRKAGPTNRIRRTSRPPAVTASSPPDSPLTLPVEVLFSEPTPAPIVPAITLPFLSLPPTVPPATTILPNNSNTSSESKNSDNEDNNDIDNDGWMDGNNRVKRQVMLANDLTEQKRDSDLRRKNLKLVKNKLYIPDDDQDESVTPPCNICTGTLLNILCQTCGKPSNFK